MCLGYVPLEQIETLYGSNIFAVAVLMVLIGLEPTRDISSHYVIYGCFVSCPQMPVAVSVPSISHLIPPRKHSRVHVLKRTFEGFDCRMMNVRTIYGSRLCHNIHSLFILATTSLMVDGMGTARVKNPDRRGREQLDRPKSKVRTHVSESR